MTEFGRKWHWLSTPESAARLELSVVSMLETIAAVSFFVWLAFNGYIVHIVLSALIAPFLLLRTNGSVACALRLAESFVDDSKYFDLVIFLITKADSSVSRGWISVVNLILFSIPTAIGCFILLAVAMMAIRIWATFLTVFKQPFASIQSIPKNWWRIVGCTDTMLLPELLPGSLNSSPHSVISGIGAPFSVVASLLEEEKGNTGGYISMAIFYIIFLLPLLLPAIFYRWSLKGSALIYLPLLWTMGGNAKERLNSITDPFQVFRRWFGCIVIATVGLKVVIPTVWLRLGELLSPFDTTGFVTLFLAPTEIPKWQLAAALNSFISWAVLWGFYPILRKSNSGQLPTSSAVVFRVSVFVSVILSLYSISVLIYNAASLQWNLISIGEYWFPWH